MTEPITEALALIASHSDRSDFVGSQTDELIAKAEARLGVRLPHSYRVFLRGLGAGNFGAEEVYGLVGSADFERAGVPDAVWITLDARRDWRLPIELVVVYFDGGVQYYAIDTSKIDEHGEAPIVVVTPRSEGEYRDLEVVHADFGSLLLALATQELDTEDD